MSELRQVFYVSRPTDAMGASVLREIMHVSQRNNRRRDMTGCLMYTGRHFAQTLEGDAGLLTEVLERIRVDKRHADIRFLLDRGVASRDCPDWSMGYLYRQDLADELERLFERDDRLAIDKALDLMSNMRPDSVMGGL